MQLAQMNVGTVLYDLDDPRLADFMNNLAAINALAEASPGFVWRLQTEEGDATGIKTSDDPRALVNMSVWESLEDLFRFVYRTDHRAFMVRRREWFQKPEGPYQVLWWIRKGRLPTAAEGLARLAHLCAHGPTPYAFTFNKAFPASEAPPVDLKPEPFCVGWA
jgi:hypothetical protein